MRENDRAVILTGKLKGYEGKVTAVASDPEGILCQLDGKYWVEIWNLKKINQIKVKYFNESCSLERHGDWIDLKAGKSFSYEAGEAFMIPLGIAIELPAGCEAHLLPRSSTFKKYGIVMTNSMGIIDEAYCGDNDQWHFPAYAIRGGEIKEGDRVAQFRIIKKQPSIDISVVPSLDNEDRGGFGSTGR